MVNFVAICFSAARRFPVVRTGSGGNIPVSGRRLGWEGPPPGALHRTLRPAAGAPTAPRLQDSGTASPAAQPPQRTPLLYAPAPRAAPPPALSLALPSHLSGCTTGAGAGAPPAARRTPAGLSSMPLSYRHTVNRRRARTWSTLRTLLYTPPPSRLPASSVLPSTVANVPPFGAPTATPQWENVNTIRSPR